MSARYSTKQDRSEESRFSRDVTGPVLPKISNIPLNFKHWMVMNKWKDWFSQRIRTRLFVTTSTIKSNRSRLIFGLMKKSHVGISRWGNHNSTKMACISRISYAFKFSWRRLRGLLAIKFSKAMWIKKFCKLEKLWVQPQKLD